MTQMVEAADDADAFWDLGGRSGFKFAFGRIDGWSLQLDRAMTEEVAELVTDVRAAVDF